MSEGTRLGFCNDNIAGIITLESTIQNVSGIITNAETINLSVDSDGNTIIYGTLDVSGRTILYGDLTVLGTLNSNGSSGNTGSGIDVSGSYILDSLLVTNKLEVSGITTLKTLIVNQAASLASLGVTTDTSLYNLGVTGTTSLKKTTVTSITDIGNTRLTTLDVSGTTTLNSLIVSGPTTFSSFVLPGTVTLVSLNTTSLDVSGASRLNTVSANSASLTTLDVSGTTTLNTLYAKSSSLNSLDVSGASNLGTLSARSTKLYYLDVSGNVDISGNVNVYGAATFLNPNGIYFPNNNRLFVTSSGTLLVNGNAISGGSGSYPSDITASSLNIGTGNLTIASSGNTRIQGNLDVSGTVNVYGAATFLNPNGIFFPNNNSLLVNSSGSLLVNGNPISSGTASYPQDISGTTLNLSSGKFRVASTGNTDISGTLKVYGRTTIYDSNGIFLSNNSLNISNTGEILINGTPFSGSSGSYPTDILAMSLEINGGNFYVYDTGRTFVGGTLDVSGITSLKGLDVLGSRFNVYDGPTRVLYYDYVSKQTNINNLTINPTGSFQAGSDGTNSLIQIIAGSPNININNTLAANTVCYNKTVGGTALAVNNSTPGAIDSTNPLVTIGSMTRVASLPNNPLSTNDLVLGGNMFIDGNITYTGLIGAVGTTGSGVTWSDISAAIASEFSGTGATSYLNISTGVTNIAGITGTVAATYGGFTSNYLDTTASTTDIINTLNMVIANQNRIIATLLNKKTSGP